MSRELNSGPFQITAKLTKDGPSYAVEVEITERISSGAIYVTEAQALNALSRVMRELDRRGGVANAKARLMSGTLFQ